MREPGEFARCLSPRNTSHPMHLIAFEQYELELHFPYCAAQRVWWPFIDILMKVCGKRGRWFEAREP